MTRAPGGTLNFYCGDARIVSTSPTFTIRIGAPNSQGADTRIDTEVNMEWIDWVPPVRCFAVALAWQTWRSGWSASARTLILVGEFRLV